MLDPKRSIDVKPPVSIGMPIYNEETFLEASVASILNQEYDNFELIISDNASSDKTEQICLELARKDRRIKYIRNDTNLGAIANFCKVFDLATGEYFMFAGGHDLWSPGFIQKCLKTLQDYPSSVLAFPSTIWIDEDNQHLNKGTSFYDTRGFDIISRYVFVLWGPMNPVYGLIRMDALKKIRMNIQMLGGDLIVLTELAFLGQFAYISDAIWYRRIKNGEESRKEKIKRYKESLFVRSSIVSRFMLHIRIPFELFRSIFKAKIGFMDKSFVFLITLVSAPIKYYISTK
ncbi:MAG: glycosyltransferase family 2 protein [Desulfobacula sp.]|nr:glycosyltransferase family 2 protein [Desulfobacula sp.]